MLVTRVMLKQSTIAIVALALSSAACERKGPTPNESAPTEATTQAAEPSKPSADPHSGLTPEQQAAIDRIPRPEPDAGGKIDLGAMTVQVPKKWEFVKPKALMRRAQFSVPGPSGDAEAIVFFMGKAGAGSEQRNIDRWISQFTDDSGDRVVDVTPKEKKISGFDVTQLEVAGNYGGGMTPTGQPGQAKPDQRLIAAIVDTPKGPYYIKLLGPDATVAANRDAFNAMLASMTPVE